MTKFVNLVRGEKTIEIHLIEGVGAHGKPCYSFVAMESDMARKFAIDTITQTCNPADYGAVIHSGAGTPSDFIKESIRQKYGRAEA